MFNGSNCEQKSQLSEILTEPLNPRELYSNSRAQTLKWKGLSAVDLLKKVEWLFGNLLLAKGFWLARDLESLTVRLQYCFC